MKWKEAQACLGPGTNLLMTSAIPFPSLGLCFPICKMGLQVPLIQSSGLLPWVGDGATEKEGKAWGRELEVVLSVQEGVAWAGKGKGRPSLSEGPFWGWGPDWGLGPQGGSKKAVWAQHGGSLTTRPSVGGGGRPAWAVLRPGGPPGRTVLGADSEF